MLLTLLLAVAVAQEECPGPPEEEAIVAPPIDPAPACAAVGYRDPDPSRSCALAVAAGDRMMVVGLWMGAGGAAALAAGAPMTLVGVNDALSGTGSGPAAWLLLPGVVLGTGGAISLLLGPVVGGAGGLGARRGLADPPGLALPVATIAAPVVAFAYTAWLASPSETSPYDDVGPEAGVALLAGVPLSLGAGYVLLAVDRGVLRRAGVPTKVMVFPAPGQLVVTGAW